MIATFSFLASLISWLQRSETIDLLETKKSSALDPDRERSMTEGILA